MEVVETVVALVLSISIILVSLYLIYPYIARQQAEQRLQAAKTIAFAVRDTIEEVVSAGVGASTTLNAVLPEDIVSVSGNNSIEFIVYKAPPYSTSISVANGSVTTIALEPRVENLAVILAMKTNWSLTVSGLSRSGGDNSLTIEYEKPFNLTARWG